MTFQLQRYAAFGASEPGGNPAGVWMGDALPAAEEMQRIAAEVGDSETAFITPRSGARRTVRYFSPEAEVPFCGHATVASGVALGHAEGPGTFQFETRAGEVPVEVTRTGDGFAATLTSVAPRFAPAEASLVESALDLLGWPRETLDPSLPAAKTYAGAWHLVLATRDRSQLSQLEYDFAALRALMEDAELTTLNLVHREKPEFFHARNPFPVGGVFEDPATGAAAAALGGYLREAKLASAPTSFEILQGQDMGRPSRIKVSVPSEGGVRITGGAYSIPVTEPTR